MDRVAIALGSNLGDRIAHLDYAVARLRDRLSNVCVSRYHDTVPVGVLGPHPLYLNAALVADAPRSADALMAELLTIEAERGRIRPYANAPRTLDLDLILFGDSVIDRPAVKVPHPRFRERRFVLAPLSEIAPEMRDPVTGKTIAELLAAL